jgi:hypothetical protein
MQKLQFCYLIHPDAGPGPDILAAIRRDPKHYRGTEIRGLAGSFSLVPGYCQHPDASCDSQIPITPHTVQHACSVQDTGN